MKSLQRLLVLTCAALLSWPALTWSRQVRDAGATAQTARTGSGSISGVVVDGVTGAPVRRVTVVASDQSGAINAQRVSVTEDDGRFVFRGLPAGRFVILGTKPTYLPTAYGVIKPMRPGSTPTGTAIALADGQQFTDATLRITRGCVVTGVVRGTDGQPVRGATIAIAYATRAPMTGDRVLSTLQTNGTVTRSDDSIGPYSSRGPTWNDKYAKPDLVAPGHKIVQVVSTTSTLNIDYPQLRVGSGTTIMSSQLMLNSDGTYTDVARYADGNTFTEYGYYTVNNSAITFNDQTDQLTYGGSISGSVLTEIGQFTAVYQKD